MPIPYLQQVLEKFDQSDLARFQPATEKAWEYTKEDFKTLLSTSLTEAYERGRADGVREFADFLKGQLGSYEINGKPLKDFEYDAPYNDTYGAIDGSVNEFLSLPDQAKEKE